VDIAKAVAEALEHSQSPPPNESNTCEWVILPILYAIGYAKRDVVSRDADSAGKFPDYTLLPGEPQHTFYVEAKAWKVDLEDGHANQALNYANQNGRRWVVLTNGRHWRLYDNDIRGMPSDKMVAEMHLEHGEQTVRFLEAIGKASVCSGMLPQFAAEEADRRKRAQEEERLKQEVTARRARLSDVLEAELAGESSRLLAAMLAHLQGREGLGDVTAGDLLAHFTGGPIENEEPPRPDIGRGPPSSEDVLVIPARDAWSDYQRFGVYMCQPRRKFRPTSHIAFYRHKAIETSVPRILQVVEEVILSEDAVSAMPGLIDVTRDRLLRLVHELRRNAEKRHLEQKRKVLFLSLPQSSETITLPHRIVHQRATAFTQGQRYVSLCRIRAAPKTTTELTHD
jgi:hypothetical protein